MLLHRLSLAWAAVALGGVANAGALPADPLSDLINAVKAGDEAKVRAALKAGADPSDSDGTYGSVLEEALRYMDVPVLKALEEGGGNFKTIENHGWNALDLVLQHTAPPEVLKMLLDSGLKITPRVSNGYTALMMYGPTHEPAMTKVLIEAGEDVSAFDATKGWSPLSLAAFYGKAEVVKLLLDHGAKPDQKVNGGRTALHIAAARGGSEAVKIISALLDAHADANIKDHAGWTPLMYAVRGDSGPLIDALVKGGANVEAKGAGGYRAISVAAIYGSAEAVKHLIAAKANVNVKDEQGRSALGWALVSADPAQAGRWGQSEGTEKAAPTPMSTLLNQIDASEPEEKIKALISAGADVNAVDPTGWTPLMLAAFMWDVRMYQNAGKQMEDLQTGQWQHGEWEKFAAKHDAVAVLKALISAGAIRRDGHSDALDVAAQRSDDKRGEMIALLRGVKVKSQD